MNKNRRGQLEQAIGFMQTAANIIEEMKDEEQDSYDNPPRVSSRQTKARRCMRKSP